MMANDVPAVLSYEAGDRAFYVSVRGDADSGGEPTGYGHGLRENVVVHADLGPAPWGAPLYGMLTDQFGVPWFLDLASTY